MNELIEVKPIENNPLAIIANAVEKGFDADQLGKLVDLHERIEAMNSKRAYQEAMNACQEEMPVIITDKANKHTQSRYATLGPLIHAVKPVYTKHGFSLSFHQGEIVPPREGWMRIVCDVMHNRGHRETKWMDLPIDGTGAKGGSSSMNAVQGVGSTSSYGERYLVCKIFNLPISDTDLDGNVPEPTLSQEQIDTIEKLILDADADKKKLLDWAQVSRIADVPAKMFVNARDMLQKKVKAKTEGAK